MQGNTEMHDDSVSVQQPPVNLQSSDSARKSIMSAKDRDVKEELRQLCFSRLKHQRQEMIKQRRSRSGLTATKAKAATLEIDQEILNGPFLQDLVAQE